MAYGNNQEEYPPANEVAEHPHERDDGVNSNEGDSEPKKSAFGNFMADLTKEERDFDHAPVVLPWRIGLFLLTSTMLQNFSYCYATYLTTNLYSSFTVQQQLDFSSLVYYVLYWGPVFGIVCDFVRIRRERYRPVIIISLIINAVLGFVCFATKNITLNYGACLMVSWLMEVVIMFVYIPMNAVVINYGNSVVESPDETSARIGGMMAQAMVWRNTGTFLYQFVYIFGYNAYGLTHYITMRYFCLIGAVLSLVLVLQVLFVMKRHYFTDHLKVSLKNAQRLNFYRDALNLNNNQKRRAVLRQESPSMKLFFVLCFTFLYFILPDPLVNTKFSFDFLYTGGFSVGLKEANSMLTSLGSVLGALAYALWMYFAQRTEAKRGRVYKIVPFTIVLAGCLVWISGIFFHFFGEMGSTNTGFKWTVYYPFECIYVGAALVFARMPPLSLTAMHCPRFFEATAFELFSVAMSGASNLSYGTTSSVMTNLGVSASKGYWKLLLICMAMRLIPMVPAGALPRYRDDDTIPAEHAGEEEKLDNEPMGKVADTDASPNNMEPIDVEEPSANGRYRQRE